LVVNLPWSDGEKVGLIFLDGWSGIGSTVLKALGMEMRSGHVLNHELRIPEHFL